MLYKFYVDTATFCLFAFGQLKSRVSRNVDGCRPLPHKPGRSSELCSASPSIRALLVWPSPRATCVRRFPFPPLKCFPCVSKGPQTWFSKFTCVLGGAGTTCIVGHCRYQGTDPIGLGVTADYVAVSCPLWVWTAHCLAENITLGVGLTASELGSVSGL